MSDLYRKKPIVIEASDPLTRDNAYRIANWCHGAIEESFLDGAPAVIISTLEGDMRADLGDRVIRGVKGEFYPCKPDIFDATYEPAEETT